MSSYIPEPDRDIRYHLQPRRPASIQVIGILHLVFGGFGLLGGLCAGVTQAIGPANFMPTMPPPPAGAQAPPIPLDMAPRLQRFLDAEIPFYTGTLLIQTILGLVLSVMLIVAGIGLLFVKPWSRKLSLVYAISSVLFQLAGMVFTIAFVLPATNKFYLQLEQEFPRVGPLFAFSRASMWAGMVFVPLGLVYPIVVFVLLTRRKVIEAFQGQPPPSESANDVVARSYQPPSTSFTNRPTHEDPL
jgi:hypothetical protein